MAANRQHRYEERWICSVVTGLLVVMIPWLGAWPQGSALNTGPTRPRSVEEQPYVVVQQGQLSVDLREADLGEVLAEIGRQTGIHMVLGSSARKRISAQFAGVELETGLRHLLHLTSLSHIILYTPGSAGAVAITEVRVFGEKQAGTPPQQTVAERDVEDSVEHTDHPFRTLLEQAHAIAPQSPGSEQREAAQGDEQAAARRLLEIFRPTEERGADIPIPTTPVDDPGQQAGGSRVPR